MKRADQLSASCASRRGFLAASVVGGLSTGIRVDGSDKTPVSMEELARIANQSVLDVSFLEQPVRIASIELLRAGRVFLVRTRSTDGAEAVTVPHQGRMNIAYPIFLELVAPSFIGRDARDLEQLLWDVYRHRSNYKLQGLAFWICVAAVEMSLLELMGQIAGRPLADFFGGMLRREIPVYVASGNRGNSPESEVDHLRRLAAEFDVQALKYRLGGRMSRNADSLPGRSEALIPSVREAFGDEFTLYVDANSSYDAAEGIRIGRMLEAHDYGFFEEPCEFDDLWSTKQVTDALRMPVAGGEQEFSMNRWRWTIANRGVDIVQPDLHYGGGIIHAVKVARMAEAAGLEIAPHMSGGGLGYLEVVHFASWTTNIGGFMEFKGDATLPVSSATSSLKCEQGVVQCPTGPGFGVTLDEAWVRQARPVRSNP